MQTLHTGLAQSDREFAEKALELLGDAEARQKLSAAAARFAQEWNRKQVEALLSCLDGSFSDAVPSASRTARV